MKALIIRGGGYEVVTPEEGHRLVDAGEASWAAGLVPARPERATLESRETPEKLIQPKGERPRKGRR